VGAETQNKEVLEKGTRKPLDEPLKPSTADAIDRAATDAAQLPTVEEARRKEGEAEEARPK